MKLVFRWRRAARKRVCRTSPSFARVCSLYNNIRTPGQLQPTATFYLFKDHIEPKWEDPKNTNGGCWTASVPNKGQNSKGQLDAWWLHGVRSWEGAHGTAACVARPQVFGMCRMAVRAILPSSRCLPDQVLACIGEQFTEGEEVCGIAVNIRPKGDRIELWTRTAANEAAQVCSRFRTCLGLLAWAWAWDGNHTQRKLCGSISSCSVAMLQACAGFAQPAL